MTNPNDDDASGIDPMKNWQDESIDVSLPQEQQDIQFVRNKRKQIVTGLMSSGVPQDPKLLALTLTALTDMDRTAVQRMRIKTDEKKNDNDSATAGIMAQILNKISANTGMQVPGTDTPPGPKLPDTVDLSGVTQDVMRQGLSTATYETFVKEQGM